MRKSGRVVKVLLAAMGFLQLGLSKGRIRTCVARPGPTALCGPQPHTRVTWPMAVYASWPGQGPVLSSSPQTSLYKWWCGRLVRQQLPPFATLSTVHSKCCHAYAILPKASLSVEECVYASFSTR